MIAVKHSGSRWQWLAAIFLHVILAGCGGDSGGNSGGATLQSGAGPAGGVGESAPIGAANGIWEGLLSVSSDPTFFDFMLVLMIDGVFVAYGEEADSVFVGNYVATGGGLSGELRRWRPAAMLFDGAGTLSAEISQGEVAAVIAMADQGVRYDLHLFSHPSYQSGDPANLAAVQGDWEDSGGEGTLHINAEGAINGEDDNGCRYDGRLSVWEPASSLPLYKIDYIEVTSCSDAHLNNTYIGWAFSGVLDDLTYYLHAADADGVTTHLVFHTIFRK